MDRILILLSAIFLTSSTSVFAEGSKIIAAGEPKQLKTYQVDLDIDSVIEKRDSEFSPCYPPISTEIEVYQEVMKFPNFVQILKFEYIDSKKSLESCPDRAILKARVRYLSE